MSDSLLARISRIVSGVAHSAVASAEKLAPVAVLEQAIRDIDEAERDVRAEIGKVEAAKYAANQKTSALRDEHRQLAARIEIALQEGADTLAESGVARQLDIENQGALLERGLADMEEDIAKLSASLAALQASRREAREKLKLLRTAAEAGAKPGEPAGPRGVKASGKADAAIAAAARIAEDMTGIDAGDRPKNQQELEDLAELQRRRLIAERLAAARARVAGEHG